MMGYSEIFLILYIILCLLTRNPRHFILPLPSTNCNIVLGKAEGQGTDWHGHITALTVAPEYRRLTLARKLSDYLEKVSDETYEGYFMDLYVRCGNTVAIDMYEGMGYSVFRRVKEYYGKMGPGEKESDDAFGMFITYMRTARHFLCALNTPLTHDFLHGFADMRKPLTKDPHQKSIRRNGRDVLVSASSVS